jgi:hypothetical protein
MDALKQRYNLALKREQKAEIWLNKATDEQLEKWIPEFNKIIVELSQLIYLIEKQKNRKLSYSEVSEGFKGV